MEDKLEGCVLRYKLNFAADTLRKLSKLEAKCFYSPPFYFGGIPLAWRLLLSEVLSGEGDGMEEDAPEKGTLGLYLACDNYSHYSEGVDHSSKGWEAEVVECKLYICSQSDTVKDVLVTYFDCNFSHSSANWGKSFGIALEYLLDPVRGYLKDDSLVFKAVFTVKEVSELETHLESFSFLDPNYANNDVAFAVEDGKKVYANRGYLTTSASSSVFTSMLTANQQKQSISLGDVSQGEFIELLLAIYPSQKPIDEHNVEFLLKLSDKFRLSGMLKKCEDCLVKAMPKSWALSKCLYIMQTYPSLANYRQTCMDLVSSGKVIESLRKEGGYRLLSNETKAMLLDKFSDM